MNIRKYLHRYLILVSAVSLMAGLGSPVARSDEASGGTGALVGVIADSAKLPVVHATVTARQVGGSGIRATISGSDGVYSFSDLPSGRWSITSEVEGYPGSAATEVDVAPSKATRRDIAMSTPDVKPVKETSSFAAMAREAAETVTAAVTPAAPMNSRSRVTAAAPAVPTVPEALQSPDPAPEHDTVTPLANVGNIGWMNGNTRGNGPVFDTKFFTPELRLDVNYLQSGNHPIDHTVVGSTEVFRSSEFQIEQVSFGGDFHWENVRARFLSMFGMFATTTPRNDASGVIGQWNVQDAYRYFSEANAGYHFDVGHGLNVDAGVFVSYIGLFSYYNFDNWTYQPSFVSSNTPWFFNGLRVQWWPTQNLKIEPWLINGWQSYNKFNRHPGLGGQILWIPDDSLKLVFNTYTAGQDNLSCQTNNNNGQGGTIDSLCQPQNGGPGNAAAGSYVGAGPPVNYANVTRVHEDDSVLWKYYDARGTGGTGLSKMALSFTVDLGCEYGGGVHCSHGPNKEAFIGAMLYNRAWFHNDLYAVTIGGGFMNNPGRYLALTPPINGATAASGSPYFTQQPGQALLQWDGQINLQYMPRDWITWWTEATYRHSSAPYWSGVGGVTPPGGNNGSPASCVGGGADPNTGNCSAGDWFPDLRTREVIWGAGVMVKF